MIPISTLFIGIHCILGLVLSCIVAIQRSKNRIWHGSSVSEARHQPNYLQNPSSWQTFIENWTKQTYPNISSSTNNNHNPELLQRKIRAHCNFTEYTPQALLMIVCLEIMITSSSKTSSSDSSSTSTDFTVIWLLGIVLTISRITHAYGLIVTYGPSINRAIGYFGTLFVYFIGGITCFQLAWNELQS